MSISRKSLVLAVALVLAGCGDDGKEIASGTFTDEEGKSGSYQVTEKEGTTTINVETDKGVATIRTGADAVKSLPAGLPLYPGATVDSGASMTGTGANGDSGGMVAFQTSDSPEKVIAFYKKAATNAGFKISMEMTTGDARMIGGDGKEGKGGFHLSVSTREEGGSNATLIAGNQ